jgi:hypothetical protein
VTVLDRLLNDMLLFVFRSSPRTSFDTVIAVFRGTSEGGCSAICVGTNDDHGIDDPDLCSDSPFHSAFLFASEPPEGRYYIAVSGYNADQFGPFELFLLSIPEEDDTIPDDGSCALTSANWINIDPEGVIVRGATTGAPSNLPTVEGCSIDNGSPTAWFQFQSTADATIVLTTW